MILECRVPLPSTPDAIDIFNMVRSIGQPNFTYIEQTESYTDQESTTEPVQTTEPVPTTAPLPTTDPFLSIKCKHPPPPISPGPPPSKPPCTDCPESKYDSFKVYSYIHDHELDSESHESLLCITLDLCAKS